MFNIRRFCFFSLVLFISLSSIAQEHVPQQADSLKKLFLIATNDSLRFVICREIYSYYEEVNRDSALHYSEIGLQLSYKAGKMLAQAVTLDNKAYQLIGLGRYAEALQCLLQAFQIAQDANNDKEKTWPLFTSFSFSGNNRLLAEAYTHHIYGILMWQTENGEQEVFHFKQARRISKEIGHSVRQMMADMNLGQYYGTVSQMDSTLFFEKEAEVLAFQSGFKKYLGRVYTIVGNAYFKQNNKQRAKEFYYKAIQSSLQQNNLAALANSTYFALARFYLSEHNKDSALYYSAKDLELFQTLGAATGSTVNLGTIYENLYRSYQINHQKDSAYKYQQLALETNDSLYKIRIKNLADFQAVGFNEQLHLQNIEKEKIAYQSKVRIYALLTGIAVFLIIAVILFRNNRQKQKANDLLKVQKLEIEEQKKRAHLETSLERVRAIAMGMRKPEDMLDICRTIAKELEEAGIKEIRNVQTAIFHDSKGSYTNYEFYAKHDKTFITETEFKNHTISEEFARHMMKGSSEVFKHSFTGKEVKDWLEYQKGTNVFIDSNLERASSLTYYWYSLGEVALGTSTYQPLTEEEIELFKRFRNVFELAYRRYLDIEKAEAQAREAEIELALERVRAKTMSMQKPSELIDVINVIGEQIINLGFDFDWVNFSANGNDVSSAIDIWNFFFVPGVYRGATRLSIPYFDHPVFTKAAESIAEYYNSGKEFSIVLLNKTDKDRFLDHLFTNTIYKGLPYEVKMNNYNGEAYLTSNVVLKDTWLSIGKYNAKPFTDEQNIILMRLGSAFGQTYTRFLDLQKAEAQARESQIQLSLERVRARAMAMQTSEELNALVGTLFTELTKLDFVLTRCTIMIYDAKTNDSRWLMANSEAPDQPMSYLVQYHTHAPNLAYVKGWQERTEKMVYILQGEIKKEWDDFLFFETGLSLLPDFVIAGMRAPDTVYLNASFANFGNLSLASLEPLPEEHFSILNRFANVFDLTYTRFNDLKQAEGQAQESKIQLALERVRARTMAMQRSDELKFAATLLFQQAKALGVPAYSCGYNIWEKGENQFTSWMSTQDGTDINGVPNIPLNEDANFSRYVDSKEKGETFFVLELRGKRMQEHYQYLKTIPAFKEYFDYAVSVGFDLPETQYHYIANFSQGNLLFITLEPCPEFHDVFKRFASVFEQTYTRFLDLQRAEAQAREAQIEAALEKVRARAMSMQKPNELVEVAELLRKEMGQLGVEELETSSIYIHHEDTQKTECWYAIMKEHDNERKLVSDHMTIGLQNTWVGRQMLQFYHSGEKQVSIQMNGTIRKEWINYCADHSKILTGFYGENIPDRNYHLYRFSGGYMGAASVGNISAESWDLLKRATNVFSLAYTRFSDLQQAEAQAREATIEAALEKVRGKAMAMHNSKDLSDAASMVFTELRKLGVDPIRCGVGLLNRDSTKAQLYSAIPSINGDSLSLVGWVRLEKHPVLERIYDTWLQQEDYFPELRSDELKSYYHLLLSGLSVPMPDLSHDQKQFGCFIQFFIGCLYVWSDVLYSEEKIKILRRFAAIIDLTFRRYIELQKSEAATKEAVKQSALDRIRADIASMRTVDDLERITPLIWNELTILGVRFIRCGVFIMDEEEQQIQTFLSTPDGKGIAAFHLPFSTPGNIANVISHWQKKEIYTDHWDEDAFKEFADSLVKQGAMKSSKQYLSTMPSGGFHLHFVPFQQGMLYVGNINQLHEEEINLLQALASAFSTAYARYEDFNKMEAAKKQVDKMLSELKQAQTQLVQAEKMASLGELTAGIAHEIQNPLNFINNFSEVNKELIEEMKQEISKENFEEVKLIANDISENELKINHHGKRADGIVKSMLQHSRKSAGQKEEIDINSLVDEYLRLSYHGLRAKDKSFNAILETHFDSNVGKVKIIGQDVGRVLLNLFNNAFYAVSEKKKQLKVKFEPVISVRTQRVSNKIIIVVRDNGTGIPEKVLDKIYQPFFTTKPTGEGTGLGLSLSYDIITKGHGGEMKVETSEGKGSEFIIQLPISSQNHQI